MNKIYQVYQVSDSTGETLDRIFISLKAQFTKFDYKTLINAEHINNLVSKIGKRYNTSIIVKDQTELVSKVKEIKDNNMFLSKLGTNSRKYAENFFNINQISNKFIDIIEKL